MYVSYIYIYVSYIYIYITPGSVDDPLPFLASITLRASLAPQMLLSKSCFMPVPLPEKIP